MTMITALAQADRDLILSALRAFEALPCQALPATDDWYFYDNTHQLAHALRVRIERDDDMRPSARQIALEGLADA